MGVPAIFEGSLVLILCYHSTAIDAIPLPCLYLKQCVSIRSVGRSNILGGWFHVIINLQPLITDKRNFFCPVGGVENASLNRVPWGRWWGGRILDIWWRIAGSLSKGPSASLSSQTTVNHLVQSKVSPGTVSEKNKTDSYERPRSVTWD